MKRRGARASAGSILVTARTAAKQSMRTLQQTANRKIVTPKTLNTHLRHAKWMVCHILEYYRHLNRHLIPGMPHCSHVCTAVAPCAVVTYLFMNMLPISNSVGYWLQRWNKLAIRNTTPRWRGHGEKFCIQPRASKSDCTINYNVLLCSKLPTLNRGI